MKKTLSLILAALMCAAMTPAVMAEEVAETPAVVEETVAAPLSYNIVLMDKAITATPAHLVAVAAAQGITVTVEEVTALLGENELTPAAAVAAFAALGITVTEEEVIAAVYAVAAPIEKYEISEISVGFTTLLLQYFGITYDDSFVDGLAVVEEEGLLNVATILTLLNSNGFEIDEAGIYDATIAVLEYLQANYTVDSVRVDENGNPIVEEEAAEEVVEETAVVEEETVAEEVVEEEVSKYPVILEETPTFGLFTNILSKFTFRG